MKVQRIEDVVGEKVTIKELTEKYVDNEEEGVVGYGGKLDIRPPYQREFVYEQKEQNLVIHSVRNNFPLSIMYWNVKDDGTFEVLDGQQRILSICEYVAGNFSIDGLSFNNLTNDIQEDVLNYPLDIYVCKGKASKRIEWFEIINVAGKALNPQELLNAIYSGAWATAARKIFSKTDCPAYRIGKQFMSGTPINQDYLETILKWISDGNIKEYMGKHQHETNANELWNYYENVIDWVKVIFVGSEKSNMRKQMQSVAWGVLYNKFKHEELDSKKIQTEVNELFEDGDITKEDGIYAYVLDGNEKHLNIRAFNKNEKKKAYKACKGICANKKTCPRKGKKCEFNEMQADHITPWSKGGKTELDNCQMLCANCNRVKSNI